MKSFLKCLSGILVCLNLCGCMTCLTIDKARGAPEKNDQGKSEPTETPQPGYYALAPLAVVGDAATLPFQLIFALIMSKNGCP